MFQLAACAGSLPHVLAVFAVCYLGGRLSEQSGGTFAFLGAKDVDSFSILIFPGTRVP